MSGAFTPALVDGPVSNCSDRGVQLHRARELSRAANACMLSRCRVRQPERLPAQTVKCSAFLYAKLTGVSEGRETGVLGGEMVEYRLESACWFDSLCDTRP